MRAIIYDQCGPADKVLQLADVPAPNPGPGEVLIRIAASGINPHDVKKRSGWLAGAPLSGAIIPHSDGAGTVVELGAGSDPKLLNQRVFFGRARAGYGTAAELCVMAETDVFTLPDSVSFLQGASLGIPAFTAWLCTLIHQPLVGDTILVHSGSGAAGRVVVEMANWAGARVIATAGSSERAKIARERGASHVLNYHDTDLIEQVLSLTGGLGVDRIVDVDLAANMATNIRLIKPHGLISSYSCSSNREPILPYYGFALKAVRIDFIQGALLRPIDRNLAGKAITTLLSEGRVLQDVTEVMTLQTCAQAHNIVENGRSDGNVVLDLNTTGKGL